MTDNLPDDRWRVPAHRGADAVGATEPVTAVTPPVRPLDDTQEIPAVAVPPVAPGPTFRYPPSPSAAAPPPPPPPHGPPPYPQPTMGHPGPSSGTRRGRARRFIGAAAALMVIAAVSTAAILLADAAANSTDIADEWSPVPVTEAPASTEAPNLPETTAPEPPPVEEEAEVPVVPERPAPTTTDPPSEGGGLDLNPFDTGVMPDVTCLSLWDAQDEIWSAGVLFASPNDASGRGRFPIIGSEWVVVDQQPDPGEEFGEFEAVLDVVRTNEPNPC